MYSTQLSDYKTYNTANLQFSKPEVGNIPGQKLTFKRIRIATRNGDGTTGDLVLSTPSNLLSFGLQESRDMVTNAINGYVLPICLWNRNGATKEEEEFTKQFHAIVDVCKDYLLQNKDEIEKYDLDAADLKKFNPLYYKMEKGKIVEGKSPMLYGKTLVRKKDNQILTIFVNEDTNQEMNPMEIMNKQCYVTAAIKFESIFIGNKISLQVKLYEVVVKPIDKTVRGLLRPNFIPKTAAPALEESSNRFSVLDDEEDEGSLELEDEVVNEEVYEEVVEEQVEEEQQPVEDAFTVVETKKKRGGNTKKK